MSPAPLADAARTAERLGLLGGSFDPPHLGHLHVARTARAAFGLDHVVFVPAARPPHKPGRRLASGEQRLEMLALLLRATPWASVWDVELERAGPSYTVDTLETLRGAVGPGSELFLLLGRDNLEDLPGWHRVEALLALAQPIIVARSGSRFEVPRLVELAPHLAARVREGCVEATPLEVSSSELRRGEGLGDEGLPPELRDYLVARQLYGLGP